MNDFRKIADEIDAVDIEAELEAQDDLDDPDEAGIESPTAEDESVEDPGDEGEPEAVEPEGDEDTPSEPEDVDEDTEGEDEDIVEPEVEDEAEAEPTFEIDGEEVPLSQVLEWRDGRADLKAAHTRAAQRAAELEQRLQQEREQAQQGTAARQELLNDLVNDTNVSKLIRKHPETLTLLMQEPQEARKLVGDVNAVSAFWEDYEAIKDNPRLAERLSLAETPEQEDQVSQEVVQQRQKAIVQGLWTGLDQAIDAVADERDIGDDEARDTVREAFLQLAGMPTDRAATREEVLAATRWVWNAMVRQTGQGPILDRKLIDDRFDLIETKQQARERREAEAAEEHNRAVDAQLSDQNDIPTTPAGDGPTSPPPKPEPVSNLRDVLDQLDEIDESALA